MMSFLCITIISLMLVAGANSHPFIGDLQIPDDVSDDIGLRAFLLCHIPHDNSTLFDRDAFQIKWTKVAVDGAEPEDVLTARGIDKETFGSFQNRVFLYTEEHNSTDASIIILNVTTEDTGEYRCEISGIDDVEQAVFLNVEDHLVRVSARQMWRTPGAVHQTWRTPEEATPVPGQQIAGVVFPYSPHLGRYNLNFEGAVRACAEQNAVVASYDQLFEAWKGGLDWCNAGWLNDGTVQYPITKPRDACGGSKTGPGLRNHGRP
uniref:hyaluronan and proteoglycan link protein 1-like n=1 Tax=Monopterus albus TaxID=43700 RepID=UPI0009B3789F